MSPESQWLGICSAVSHGDSAGVGSDNPRMEESMEETFVDVVVVEVRDWTVVEVEVD